MSQLLYFPPMILGLIGGIILTLMMVSLWLPFSPANPYASTHWIAKLTLFTLSISLIWVVAIYPTHKSTLLAGHFIWDPLTALCSIGIIGLSIPVFIYIEDELHHCPLLISDYYTLGLFALFGALAMLTAGSILSFYLGLEIMSLSLYGMVGLDSKQAWRTEAAMKYMIMGVVSSVLLLYGFCLLYGVDRHLSLDTLTTWADHPPTPLLQIGGGLLFTGVLFKLGVVPFQFWVPDVYQGASKASTLFIATIPKFAAIGMGLRLLLGRFGYLIAHAQSILLSLGLLSIISGNLIALMQSNIRRLLAYSSIAHMGFILLGFAIPVTGYPMALFYGVNYCFMATILFGVLAYLTRSGWEVNTIQDLKGLRVQYPMVARLLLVVLSSMAGLPPFIGFFSKFGLLYSLLKQDCYTTAGIALLATVIGAYYYLNIIRNMYFERPTTAQAMLTKQNYRASPVVLGCSGLILISLSLSPGTLISIVEKSLAHALPLSIENTDESLSHDRQAG